MPERKRNNNVLSFLYHVPLYIHSSMTYISYSQALSSVASDIYLSYLYIIYIYIFTLDSSSGPCTGSRDPWKGKYESFRFVKYYNISISIGVWLCWGVLKDLNVTKYRFYKCKNVQTSKCDSHVLFFDHINLLRARKLILEQHFYLRKSSNSYISNNYS